MHNTFDTGVKRVLARWKRRFGADSNRWDGTSIRDHCSRKGNWVFIRKLGANAAD